MTTLMSKSSFPDRPSGIQIAHVRIWGWDLWLALVVGAAGGTIAGLARVIDFDYIWFLAPAGGLVTFAVSSLAMARSLTNTMKDTLYGQILTELDPTGMNHLSPYRMVARVGLLSAVYALVAGGIIGWFESERFWRGMIVGFGVFGAAWTVFGFIRLIQFENEHDKNILEMKTSMDRVARELRQRRKEDDGGNSSRSD